MHSNRLTHLSLFISLFSCLLIHHAVIIFLSLQSHPSLSFSITHPLLLLIFRLNLYLSWYHQHSLPHIVSLFFFLSQHSCQQPVIAQCVFRLFFCCKLLCFAPVLQCDPVGALPHWRMCLYVHTRPISVMGRVGFTEGTGTVKVLDFGRNFVVASCFTL